MYDVNISEEVILKLLQDKKVAIFGVFGSNGWDAIYEYCDKNQEIEVDRSKEIAVIYYKDDLSGLYFRKPYGYEFSTANNLNFQQLVEQISDDLDVIYLPFH